MIASLLMEYYMNISKKIVKYIIAANGDEFSARYLKVASLVPMGWRPMGGKGCGLG